MVNHPNRDAANAALPYLSRSDIGAVLNAIGCVDARPIDGWTQRMHDRLKAVGEKLTRAPDHAVWLPFSRKELSVLFHALRNVAGDDAILYLDLSTHEKIALRNAANRIADAGDLILPRF